MYDALRKACAKAGVPLLDRYGYPADDIHVSRLIEIATTADSVEEAAYSLGEANLLGDVEFAYGEEPLDEVQERIIIGQALFFAHLPNVKPASSTAIVGKVDPGYSIRGYRDVATRPLATGLIK